MFRLNPLRILLRRFQKVRMPANQHYKQFVTQFTIAEWKILRRHRLFLRFLEIDLRRAACIAADALDRNVYYVFPVPPKATKLISRNKSQVASAASWWLRRQRRFRL